MADKTTKTVDKEKLDAPEKEELVRVYIEKGYLGDETNFLVSINGVNYLLPRGEESFVPLHVAKEIELSRKAQKRLDKKQAAMVEAALKPNAYI